MFNNSSNAFIDLPLNWGSAFGADSGVSEPKEEKSGKTVSVSDALIKSLTTLGRVDIRYISDLTGKAADDVIDSLKGSIYQNPDTWGHDPYKGWETSEEYLSGNLRRKWDRAKVANEVYRGRFEDNIRAIEKVLPQAVASTDIYITLGSPWVPADVIDDFMLHLFGDTIPEYYHENYKAILREQIATRHDELTGVWEIPQKSRYMHSVGVTNTFGTNRIEALHILEDTLNMRTIKVMDEVDCPDSKSGRKSVLNKKETIAAVEKQQLLIKKFREWVWTDPLRKARLEKIFEDRYSSVRARVYDGSFLTFPTMSPKVTLYPYQKNAVARMIFSPNTLLAHDVGAGKTYEMIAAGQELRRMNLSKKNMYVVPNNLTGEWARIFRDMYPDAKLLIVDPSSFTPAKREATLEDIRDGGYDGIIIAYSCFDAIPLSKQCLIENLRAQLEEVNTRLEYGETCALRARKKRLEKDIIDLRDEKENSKCRIFFDELGVTRLFVDEAHNYKNVPVNTHADYVLGISRTGSKKCREMMDKVKFIQRTNNGGGVVMATGTPITNSITDAFVMQLYLQSGELSLLDLQNFDSWIGMFAEKVTEFEIDVDTNSYRLATRFSKFHNLPELTALLSSVADFHSVDASAGIPEHDGYVDSLIGKTPEFEDFLKLISQRADDVRSGRVKRKEDNMLKITTDGRKAALDMRLVDPSLEYTYESKVARCAMNVADIYRRTFDESGTQLVFCDSSTPKEGFNLYDELKLRLTGYGIPADEIAFIHDADNDKKRSALFKKVRSGDIRVLIGSTAKLGLGVNIQDRLIALHHLDVPWRPADMTQREGRILRQGNTNSKVFIYRYITKGSFDAYSWQLLETKQRFISALLSGSVVERSGSDVDDVVLNYAEVKALAVGNSLVKERVEAANELARFATLQHKLTESRLAMEKELLELPCKITQQKELIAVCEDDLRYSRWWTGLYPAPLEHAAKMAEAERRRALREKLDDALRGNVLYGTERTLMTYRGFDSILPSQMTPDKPYVYLEHYGRYIVELGEKEVGNLIRIDNFIDGFDKHLKDLNRGLATLEQRQRDIEDELNNGESYMDKIDFYRSRIEQIDEELGVNEDD